MNRRKAGLLGLAALAFVALSAFLVQGAQGEGKNNFHVTCIDTAGVAPHTAHNETEVGCYGHGTQAKEHGSENEHHKFVTGIATLTCNVATFEITTDPDGTVEEPLATPIYEECEDTLTGGAATVTHNGCEYTFHIERKGGTTPEETRTGDEFEGTVDLHCPEEKQIVIHLATGCTVNVPSQTTMEKVDFRNMTNTTIPTDITVEATGTTVTQEYEGGFFKCGKLEGSHALAEYFGNTTVRAFNHETNEEIDATIK